MKLDRVLELGKESLVYGIASVVGRLSALVLVPVLTRALSTDDYGLVALIGSFMSFVSIGVGMGTENGAALVFYDSTDEAVRRRAISTYAIGQAVSALSLAGAVVAASPAIAARLFGRDDARLYVVLAAAWLVVSSPNAVTSNLFRFLRRPRVVVSMSIAQVVIHVGLTFFLVVALGKGLLGVYLAQAATPAILVLAHAILLARWVSPRDFSAPVMKDMLRLGLPLLPTGLALWAINGLDRFILEHYRGLSEVALYSAAGSIASALSIVTVAFQMAIGPFALSIQNEPDAKLVYADVLTAFAAAGSALAIAVSLFGADILRVVATPRYVAASPVIPFLAFYTVAVSVGYIASLGSWIAKKPANLAWTTGLGAAANVLLNWLLARPLGLLGTGIATLLGQLVYVVALFWASQRCCPVPYRFREVAVLAALAGGLIALGRFADEKLALGAAVATKLGLAAAYPLVLGATGVVPMGRLVRRAGPT